MKAEAKKTVIVIFSPDWQALKTADNEKFSSSVCEELSGVRVDIDRKIETYENLTPAELRNAEFQASRLRKKGKKKR